MFFFHLSQINIPLSVISRDHCEKLFQLGIAYRKSDSISGPAMNLLGRILVQIPHYAPEFYDRLCTFAENKGDHSSTFRIGALACLMAGHPAYPEKLGQINKLYAEVREQEPTLQIIFAQSYYPVISNPDSMTAESAGEATKKLIRYGRRVRDNNTSLLFANAVATIVESYPAALDEEGLKDACSWVEEISDLALVEQVDQYAPNTVKVLASKVILTSLEKHKNFRPHWLIPRMIRMPIDHHVSLYNFAPSETEKKILNLLKDQITGQDLDDIISLQSPMFYASTVCKLRPDLLTPARIDGFFDRAQAQSATGSVDCILGMAIGQALYFKPDEIKKTHFDFLTGSLGAKKLTQLASSIDAVPALLRSLLPAKKDWFDRKVTEKCVTTEYGDDLLVALATHRPDLVEPKDVVAYLQAAAAHHAAHTHKGSPPFFEYTRTHYIQIIKAKPSLQTDAVVDAVRGLLRIHYSDNVLTLANWTGPAADASTAIPLAHLARASGNQNC